MMNNLRIPSHLSKCSICNNDFVNVKRDNTRGVWIVSCNSCGCFREFPAEDPESDIVEVGELTKEEAMNKFEDINTRMLDSVYGEGKREL